MIVLPKTYIFVTQLSTRKAYMLNGLLNALVELQLIHHGKDVLCIGYMHAQGHHVPVGQGTACSSV